ncbi:MAG: NTP transferase domain-containing protein [Burkholderiales bacterium]|nr:NTP transferase domain-containing protein [Burkholderiales bacterium]
METKTLPVVLVLASGRGERFLASGGTVHKLQADLGGHTVLQRTLATVKASGLRWHLEQSQHAGMGDSIAAAVRATADAPGWMILPADLPLVHVDTLLAIARMPLVNGVLFPMHEGKRGHPVRFAPACAKDLMRLSGPQGAASIVEAHPRTTLVVEDAGCTMDIDTVQDLERAKTWLAQAVA